MRLLKIWKPHSKNDDHVVQCELMHPPWLAERGYDPSRGAGAPKCDIVSLAPGASNVINFEKAAALSFRSLCCARLLAACGVGAAACQLFLSLHDFTLRSALHLASMLLLLFQGSFRLVCM